MKEWSSSLKCESIKSLAWPRKSLSKGTEGEHNILIQKNCTCQDNQQNPFHTQAAEEIICPILDLENVEMNITQT